MNNEKEKYETFLDVKTDYAFKKVFGSDSSTSHLIHFLNSVLDFGDYDRIKDLTIVDPYQVPLLKGMKDSYVDVKAVLSSGQRVIIEMQVLNVEGFEKRVLYNAAKSYSSQLKKGQDFSTLEPIIALTITDFVMFPEHKHYASQFKLMENKTLLEYSDEIQLNFIELPKFTKEESELQTATDKWLFTLRHAGKFESIPSNLNKEPEILKALEMASRANLTPEEDEIQDKRHQRIHNQR